MDRKRMVAWMMKIAFALLLLGGWHGSQTVLQRSKEAMGGTSLDRGHVLLAPANAFLNQHQQVANAVLIVTSAHIDTVLVGMALWGIFGNTTRPTVVLLLLLLFRQVSQFLVSAPVPPGMIWRYPGFPSLIVTYHTSLDFFFSGHSASATLSALEVGYRGYRNKAFVVLAALLVVMEVFCILSMRFHYTADVLTGIFAAVTAFAVGTRVSPVVDRALERLVERIAR